MQRNTAKYFVDFATTQPFIKKAADVGSYLAAIAHRNHLAPRSVIFLPALRPDPISTIVVCRLKSNAPTQKSKSMIYEI